MRRIFVAAALLALLAVGLSSDRGSAQHVGTFGGTPISASSGNVANASAVATLASVTGRTTFICGFALTSAGSTGAAIVSPTVTNVITGTQTYTYATVAGVTLGNTPLIVNFNPCLPANAVSTTIVVTLPALGAGNTNATATAWGYQL